MSGLRETVCVMRFDVLALMLWGVFVGAVFGVLAMAVRASFRPSPVPGASDAE